MFFQEVQKLVEIRWTENFFPGRVLRYFRCVVLSCVTHDCPSSSNSSKIDLKPGVPGTGDGFLNSFNCSALHPDELRKELQAFQYFVVALPSPKLLRTKVNSLETDTGLFSRPSSAASSKDSKPLLLETSTRRITSRSRIASTSLMVFISELPYINRWCGCWY